MSVEQLLADIRTDQREQILALRTTQARLLGCLSGTARVLRGIGHPMLADHIQRLIHEVDNDAAQQAGDAAADPQSDSRPTDPPADVHVRVDLPAPDEISNPVGFVSVTHCPTFFKLQAE